MAFCGQFVLVFAVFLCCICFQNGVSSEDYYHLATINFGHLKSSHPYIRGKAEAQLLHAMENIGFMIVTNHNIPHDVMDEMWHETKSFFNSSNENKNSVPMTEEYMYGYSATEILSRSETESGHGYETDNKETFQAWIGAPNTGRDKNVRWPEYPLNLNTSWIKYYRECEKLAASLLSSMANVLELPFDFFEDKIDDHMAALRALNYPVLELGDRHNNEERSLRCSPHSDYGALTLLRQDGVGGLQVEGKNGEWLDVISDHYDFIVNLGDLMARWTNDRFKSTRHRVVNPKESTKVELYNIWFHSHKVN